VPLSILILSITLPFVANGFHQIGKKFAIKLTVAIAGLAVLLFFFRFPDITPDDLLNAVFGGLVLGAGFGLAIRGGAVLDGTEIAALLISRKSHLLHVGDVILIMNVMIFGTAMLLLSVESAMYSILTYAAASKTIEFLIHGVEQYTAVTIISQKSSEMKEAIINQLGRGVTVYRGQGGMGSTGAIDGDQDILLCVITRLEIGSVKSLIFGIDPQAFVTTHTLTDVQGGMIKRPVLH
jgi:uncharacterized membrane-anchored protein YitT (DUF2179 family)